MAEMQISATRARTGRRATSLLAAFRLGAATVAALTLWQAAMAGQVLSGNGAALRWHEAGSYAIFTVAVATGVAAAVAWRRRLFTAGLGLLGAVVVPALVTLQAWGGYARWLALHVPLGVSLLGLALWLLALSAPGRGRGLRR